MNGKDTKQTTNRHLMALYTFVVLLPLVYFIPPWVAEHIAAEPLATTVVSVAMIVPLVSYLALPFMVRLNIPGAIQSSFRKV